MATTPYSQQHLTVPFILKDGLLKNTGEKKKEVEREISTLDIHEFIAYFN
jgi:hypothetical protein